MDQLPIMQGPMHKRFQINPIKLRGSNVFYNERLPASMMCNDKSAMMPLSQFLELYSGQKRNVDLRLIFTKSLVKFLKTALLLDKIIQPRNNLAWDLTRSFKVFRTQSLQGNGRFVHLAPALNSFVTTSTGRDKIFLSSVPPAAASRIAYLIVSFQFVRVFRISANLL